MARADFSLTWKVKRWFFDSPAVQRMVDAATREALSHIGASIRQIAQRSMRPRSPKSINYAAPGQPPKAVSNHPWIRRWIEYGLDPHRMSVVIGPIRLPGRGPNVPALHEFGGRVVIKNPRRRRPIRIGDVKPIRLLERRPGRRSGRVVSMVSPTRMGHVAAVGKRVPVALARLRTSGQVAKAEALAETLYGPREYAATYPPRPFMGPALVKAAPRLARIWAESVRAA